MHCATFSLLLAAATAAPRAFAAIYTLSDSIIGGDFLSTFAYQAIPDPTHGRVDYVDQATALSSNLTYFTHDTYILRADDTTVLSSDGPGRASVRIQSNKAYTTHVAIFDVRHMPEGCSTWPAVWESDVPNWPNGGEIDIVSELYGISTAYGSRKHDSCVPASRYLYSVNDIEPNQITVHTGSNCSMPSNRVMTGTALLTDCDVNTDSNEGCGVHAPTANSYGPAFNAIGGGWYAMERTNSFIRVFFWPRNARNVPLDITLFHGTIDTDLWGTPVAYFPSNAECNLASEFDANNIIINLTFCGDWAGVASIFTGAGCPGDCVDFVNNNPSAFTNAYWDIASLRVYEQGLF